MPFAPPNNENDAKTKYPQRLMLLPTYFEFQETPAKISARTDKNLRKLPIISAPHSDKKKSANTLRKHLAGAFVDPIELFFFLTNQGCLQLHTLFLETGFNIKPYSSKSCAIKYVR